MLAGLGFSLGLILVVVAGAELFTGNNLIVMSWVSRHISLKSLLRNWGIVYIGNFIGAVSIALLVYFAHWWGQNDSGVGATALNIANAKVSLSPIEILFRGILANALVCLAVWLASSGRSLMDKAIAIVFPIAAFVAAGFEHSIANMYFLPLGLLLSGHSDVLQAAGLSGAQLSNLTIAGAAMNILFATVGNIIGGGVMVGLVYWFIYLRSSREPAS
jgi:formate/nitrite transporter